MALVPARSLLSSAVITYLGGENETTRERMIKEWSQMMRMSAPFDFKTFMCTES